MGPDQQPEEAIGERLVAGGYDRRRADRVGDGPAVVFAIEPPPVPGPLLVTLSVHGEAPASALVPHIASEFVQEDIKFLPGCLISEEFSVKFMLVRPDGVAWWCCRRRPRSCSASSGWGTAPSCCPALPRS